MKLKRLAVVLLLGVILTGCSDESSSEGSISKAVKTSELRSTPEPKLVASEYEICCCDKDVADWVSDYVTGYSKVPYTIRVVEDMEACEAILSGTYKPLMFIPDSTIYGMYLDAMGYGKAKLLTSRTLGNVSGIITRTKYESVEDAMDASGGIYSCLSNTDSLNVALTYYYDGGEESLGTLKFKQNGVLIGSYHEYRKSYEGFNFYSIGVRNDSPVYYIGKGTKKEKKSCKKFVELLLSNGIKNASVLGYGGRTSEHKIDIAGSDVKTVIEKGGQSLWTR